MDCKHCEAVNGEQILRACGASARRSSLTLGGGSFRDDCLFLNEFRVTSFNYEIIANYYCYNDTEVMTFIWIKMGIKL